jgi:hypothetical protein
VRLNILGTVALLLIGPLCEGGSAQQVSTLVIMLERESDVFQTSPEYRISIFVDGTVIFEGKKHVISKEPIRTRIDKEQLANLLAEFERIKYYSLHDRYTASEDGCSLRRTDHAFATTTLKLDGKKKSIVHYYGCREEGRPDVVFPQALYKLEATIDEVVNAKQWVEKY